MTSGSSLCTRWPTGCGCCDETVAVLNEFAQSSAKPIQQAREKKLANDLDQFPANRFGRRMVEPIKAIHLEEEGRPIETVWDATVAATAHARSIPNTDKRVEIERAAGELLKLAG
jgi:hypothetical protein